MRWGDGEAGRFSLGTVRPALDTQPSVLTALAVAIVEWWFLLRLVAEHRLGCARERILVVQRYESVPMLGWTYKIRY
jgi:hypothetical protein